MKYLALVSLFAISINCFGQQKYSVVFPENYDESIAYPLFIVFHGGNSNKEIMMDWWVSNRLSKEYITVYMEASTLDRSPDRWGWRNLPKERLNIKKYYSEVIGRYLVNEEKVYVGGFSLGGLLSVDMVMTETIPVKGFISVNHGGGVTKYFTDKNIAAAKGRNVRGYIISGEDDYRYKRESLELKKGFEKLNFPLKYISIENVGHSAPGNFSDLLEEALKFLIKD